MTVATDAPELKMAVAKECNNDLDRYCEGKDAYVKALEARAVLAYGKTFTR